MSIAVIHSRASAGITAPAVIVETHISNGLPNFFIVGLPETAVKESRDRVRSAILNSYFDFPAQRITVNLAPADLPKEGGRFDLPIALGILAASGQIPVDYLAHYEFAGELALTGELRPIQGALAFALGCGQAQRKLIIPAANAAEASLNKSVTILPADNLLDVCAHLTEKQLLRPFELPCNADENISEIDLSDIQGQVQAKRALEIAAAGGHSLLMIGPPGTGKTMLASRLPTILPDLSDQEAIEVATIASIRNQFKAETWRKRPFRAPHHTASSVALVGGGTPLRPGEISLAHRGVLFLDELPEFHRHVLEALREPLESGLVNISRAARQAEFPAQFQLISAMNPCPCGQLGNPQKVCRCSPEQIQRYHSRLSGPLLDRIDMQIEVPSLPPSTLTQTSHGESSAVVRTRVEKARKKQLKRANKLNHQLRSKELDEFCQLKETEKNFIERAIQQMGLSARTYHRILRIARTIADLADSLTICSEHLGEAISYRRLDRLIKR